MLTSCWTLGLLSDLIKGFWLVPPLTFVPPCPQENVMGSVEAGCEGGWLPHPEEQLFLDQLYAFMDRQGSPIHKVPHLGFKKSRF